MTENSEYDQKSLRLIKGNTADWDELAKDCVAFANGKGGYISIGIEDGELTKRYRNSIRHSIGHSIRHFVAINQNMSNRNNYNL